MSKSRILVAVATVATGGALLVPTVASAHANSVTCVDQSTSTWRITNDHPLSETFTSTEGPSGSVAGGNGQFTDVVWNGDSLHVTGTWTDGYVGQTTGTGDCSPETQPTTTTLEPTTTLVTTTTAQETTTSTTSPPSTSGPTTTSSSVPSTSTTSVVPSTTTASTTTSTTSVSSSSTTVVPPTTPPSSTPTTPPPTSTPSVPPTSTPTPCIPQMSPSATQSPTGPSSPLPGTPSAPPCGQLPATGNPDLGILTGIAAATILAGAFMLTKTRR